MRSFATSLITLIGLLSFSVVAAAASEAVPKPGVSRDVLAAAVAAASDVGKRLGSLAAAELLGSQLSRLRKLLISELGWQPVETFDSGLQRTIKWYLANREWVESVKSGEYLKWINEHYHGT